MDKELYRIALNACKEVYEKNIDLGTTEFYSSSFIYQGEVIQVLAIAGTNELSDWKKNLNLWSKNGIKKAGVDAAIEIHNNFSRVSSYKLLVCGHSKSGPTAFAYKKLFGADWCIAFCPARAMRHWTNKKLSNTTIFIDPDDPVPVLGRLSFTHPECNIIKLPNSKIGFSIADHSLDNIEEFINLMED